MFPGPFKATLAGSCDLPDIRDGAFKNVATLSMEERSLIACFGPSKGSRLDFSSCTKEEKRVEDRLRKGEKEMGVIIILSPQSSLQAQSYTPMSLC